MPRVRYLAILSLAVLLALAGGGGRAIANAQAPPTDGSATEATRTVSVTGMGQVNVSPDAAVVRLGVRTEAETASAALAQNNRQMLAVIGALQEAGVAPEDIQTQIVQLQPQRAEPEEPGRGQGEIMGYLATNVVEVTVRALQGLGEIIDAAVQAGGNAVEGIRFQVSAPARAIIEARRLAMQDATLAAEQLASLAGATLGQVLTISEARSAPVAPERVAVDTAVGVPIQPGTETVGVTVNVTWRLQ